MWSRNSTARACVSFGLLVLASAVSNAESFNLAISAQSDIFAAGLASPPAFSGGGGVLPPEISFAAVAGQTITFPSVTGIVSSFSIQNGPDGVVYPTTTGTNIGPYGGISAIVDDPGPFFFLIGVFLTDSTPNGPAPPTLMNFSGKENFTDLSPGIGQLFFVGDGLTGTGSGQLQNFHVPANATRLFLGFADMADPGQPGLYFDNSGSVQAAVQLTSTPEPASLTLMLLGIGLAATYVPQTLKRIHKAESRLGGM